MRPDTVQCMRWTDALVSFPHAFGEVQSRPEDRDGFESASPSRIAGEARTRRTRRGPGCWSHGSSVALVCVSKSRQPLESFF